MHAHRKWADAENGPTPSYRNAFFQYDGDRSDEFTACKLPFPDVVDDQLKAVASVRYSQVTA